MHQSIKKMEDDLKTLQQDDEAVAQFFTTLTERLDNTAIYLGQLIQKYPQHTTILRGAQLDMQESAMYYQSLAEDIMPREQPKSSTRK